MNNILAFADVMQTVLGVVVALLVLLLTITVHEFGHYIVGKLLKFKINEFAIGMGPAIFKKKKKNGEIFSIRILPLGGFCAFEGEDDAGAPGREKEKIEQPVFEEVPEPATAIPEDENALSENAFNNKKPWQRILVLIAGGVTNIVFAILITTISFSVYGHFTITPAEVAAPSSEIENSFSLEAGDKILKIDGKFIYLTTDLIDALNGKIKGDLVTVTVERNGERLDKKVAMRCDVNSTGMTDYYDALEALGVATTLIFSTDATNQFTDGASLIGISGGSRIYSLTDLYGHLSELSSGDEITFDVEKDGQKSEMKIVIPDGFEEVNVEYDSLSAQNAAFKKFFGIKSYYISYAVDSTPAKISFFEGLYRAPVYGVKTMWLTLRSIGGLFNGSVSISDVSGPVGTISITSQYVSRGFSYVLNIMALIGISIGIFNLLPIPALDGGRVVFVAIEWIRGKPVNRNVESTIHFVGIIVLIAFAILVDVLKLF